MACNVGMRIGRYSLRSPDRTMVRLPRSDCCRCGFHLHRTLQCGTSSEVGRTLSRTHVTREVIRITNGRINEQHIPLGSPGDLVGGLVVLMCGGLLVYRRSM